MIKPHANTIQAPKIMVKSSLSLEKNENKFMKDNINKLKNHYRKYNSTRVKVQKDETRLPLERFD